MNKHLCPICQSDNGCGVSHSQEFCWCMDKVFPEEVFQEVPEAERDKRCICQSCLARITKKQAKR